MVPPSPPRLKASDVSDVLSKQGVTAEMPSRGVKGAGGDKDGNESAFSAKTCPGHRDHPGGVKFPLILVTLVLNDVTM